jgi:hypothetical protein
MNRAADRARDSRHLRVESPGPAAPLDCACGRLDLGPGEAGGRNWVPGCPAHGTSSSWYRQGGKAYFAAYRAYAVELQRLATEARRTGIGGQVPPPPRLADFVEPES